MVMKKTNQKLIHTAIALSLVTVPALSGVGYKAAPVAYAQSNIDTAIEELAVYYNYLNDVEKAEISKVKDKIGALTDAEITAILSADVVKKVDEKTAPGKAVNVVKDLSKVLYAADQTAFKTAVNEFRAKYAADFDKVFGTEVTVDKMVAFAKAYRAQLKSLVEAELTSGTKSKATVESLSVAALNKTLALDEFKLFDGKLTEGIGIGVQGLLGMKERLDAKVDPDKKVQYMVLAALVRAKGGKIKGSATAELGEAAPSYEFEMLVNNLPVGLNRHVTWTTDDPSVAVFNTGDTRLNVKKAGDVNVIANLFGVPVSSLYVTVTEKQEEGSVVVPLDPPIKRENDKGGNDVTITPTEEKIKDIIGQNPTIKTLVISYEPKNENDALQVSLTPEVMALLADKTVEVQFGQVSYSLPINEINLDNLGKKLGGAVTLTVSIEPGEDKGNAIGKNKLKPVTDIYDFSIVASSGEKSVEVKNFNSFVNREIEGDKAFKVNNTTAVRLQADGTFSPIPTLITGNEATLKSRTNSLYTVVESNKTFSDIKKLSAQQQAEIKKLANKLIISGNAGKFQPGTGTTRGDLVVFIVRGLGLDTSKKYDGRFTDVKGQPYYADEMMAAIDAGIVYGSSDNKFNPKKFVTRQEAAAMMARAMKFTTYDASKLDKKKTLKQYKDRGSIGSWARKDVQTVLQAGIMLGDTQGKFNPTAKTTRGQMASMMHRFLKFVDLMN